MSTSVLSEPYLSVADYLASEELSDVKREYLGGIVHPVAAASDSHCRISNNLSRMLGNQFRNHLCEAFGGGMRLRLYCQLPEGTCFYYPDAMIVCNPVGGNGWREQPAALFEIISESTRQVDEREKHSAYLQLPSLEAYIRIEQSRPEAVIESRTLEGWKRERVIGLDGITRLPTLEVELPLAELYERVIFGSGEREP